MRSGSTSRPPVLVTEATMLEKKLTPNTLLVGRVKRSTKVYGKTTYVPATAKARIIGWDNAVSAYRAYTWLEVEGSTEQHNKKVSMIGVNYYIAWEVE